MTTTVLQRVHIQLGNEVSRRTRRAHTFEDGRILDITDG